MKIAILSDSHDNWVNLTKAVEISNERGCEVMFHAGDLIAPPMVAILEQFNGLVHFVWGNNEGEKVKITQLIAQSSKIQLHGVVAGDFYEGEIDQIRVFMNHYPKISRLAAESGHYDLCIFGHNHQASQETVGTTLLVNPGEVMGYLTGQASFMIFDTKSKNLEQVLLS